MSDIQAIIDWALNTNLRIWNTLKNGLGDYWYVWLGIVFGFPWFGRLIRALKGQNK